MDSPVVPLVEVRDVVHDAKHLLSPKSAVLRVPYELFNPVGAVRVENGLATYEQGDKVANGRVVSALLADANPGERVLLQLPSAPDGEWWLCEVVKANGGAAS